ncbi:MAG: tryptophan synthase subunit alpha [Thermoplasmataceae archaeon]
MRKKLALYFTFPYPNFKTLKPFIDSIRNEVVDYVELGIPVARPYYDGPMIRKTHETALREFKSDDLKNTILGIKDSGIKSYALTYTNSFENNPNSAFEDLRIAGFDGVILPDLLIDYFDDRNKILGSLKNYGISFIPFFTSSTPDIIVKELLKSTSSWIYHGIQPSTGINVPVDISRTGIRIKEISGNRELIFGFGINNPAQIRDVVKSGADGIAIGSMLIDFIQKNDVDGFLRLIKEIRGVLDEF